MRALIVEDGYQRGALAAARALGAAGWKVGIGAPVRGFAASSRFSSRLHRVPPPMDGVDAFVAAVREAIEAGGYDIVFAAGDGELLALSERREALPAVIPYAPHEAVLRAHDKLLLDEAARLVGLAVPGPAREGPAVVKPRLTAAPGAARLRASVADDLQAAQHQASQLRAAGGEPLVQRFVDGDLAAQVAVSDRSGRVVAMLQQRATRIWPSGSGGSVRARSVAADAELSAKVEALLAELGWFGLAQVQFQLPEDGEPVLIDFNGRFYGSLALASAAGLNLPAIWAALATGGPVAATAPARTDARYHWLEADLRRAWAERRGGLAGDVAGCLAYAATAAHGLWSMRDPWPAVRHAGVLSGRLARLATRSTKRR